MNSERSLRLVEFALWVLAAAGVAVGASLVVGLLIGQDLMAVKYVTFVVGFLMFGAGSLAIQPSGPDTGDSPVSDAEGRAGGGLVQVADGGATAESGVRDDEPDDPEHRYEARLQEIGPLADHDLPYERRVSRGVKLFTASLVVLAVSLLMELAGVQV